MDEPPHIRPPQKPSAIGRQKVTVHLPQLPVAPLQTHECWDGQAARLDDERVEGVGRQQQQRAQRAQIAQRGQQQQRQQRGVLQQRGEPAAPAVGVVPGA